MKRGLALLLALLCAASLLLLTPGAAAESGTITLQDLASMDTDSTFSMEQVLALLQEAYALGYQAGREAAPDSRALPGDLDSAAVDYVLNTNSHKFHYPDCESVAAMNPKNRWDFSGTREEVLAMGYVPCKRCRP